MIYAWINERFERKRIEIWAEASKRAITSTNDNDISFYIEIIAGNTTIPVIVVDEKENIASKLNHELINAQRITDEALADHQGHLREIIEEFTLETQSQWGQELLDNFDAWVGKFWLIKPKDASLDSLLANVKSRAELA